MCSAIPPICNTFLWHGAWLNTVLILCFIQNIADILTAYSFLANDFYIIVLKFLYCDTICVFILYTLMLCVQASLFDSSEKQDGSEVDLTESKHQQTAETWRCAC